MNPVTQEGWFLQNTNLCYLKIKSENIYDQMEVIGHENGQFITGHQMVIISIAELSKWKFVNIFSVQFTESVFLEKSMGRKNSICLAGTDGNQSSLLSNSLVKSFPLLSILKWRLRYMANSYYSVLLYLISSCFG